MKNIKLAQSKGRGYKWKQRLSRETIRNLNSFHHFARDKLTRKKKPSTVRAVIGEAWPDTSHRSTKEPEPKGEEEYGARVMSEVFKYMKAWLICSHDTQLIIHPRWVISP